MNVPDKGHRPQKAHRLQCPTCGKSLVVGQSPAPPFCSTRCQMIDLGRWFNEEIGLPFEGEAGETPVENRPDPGED